MSKHQTFITEDFLLHTDYAKTLYHDYAAQQPIIDYHSHLSPADISNNRQFNTISEAWLEGDHYKWRAMRTLGIDEQYITGKATAQEKFAKWAYAVPYTMRNPLYHWAHLELKRYFDVDELLKPDSAENIYSICNELLGMPNYRVQGLIDNMNVQIICTTDDPCDTLEHHQKIKSAGLAFHVLPTFRPDKILAVDDLISFNHYLKKLSASSEIEIQSWDSLMQALQNRVQFFHNSGCRLSDHGLDRLPQPTSREENPEKVFNKLLKGESIDPQAKEIYQFAVLQALSKMYHAQSWVQQFHLGALRNNNARLLMQLGPDTGFDSVGDFLQAQALSHYLNTLDSTNQLTKTILYNLNPADNEMLATMIGNFNDGSVRGKIQYGSGWWFLDQKDGMTKQLNTLSNMGLLSCFVGMLTDSRSFLSFPRHEYFRRILCQLIGEDVKNGELPWDEKWLGQIVRDVCYGNAKGYFNFT